MADSFACRMVRPATRANTSPTAACSRHTVSTVFVNAQDGAPRSYPDTAHFMRQVAQAGNGEFVRSRENASLSVMILRAIFG